jgi:TRAP-type mannitol/chloroaromatic compound transport system permease small subunit
MVSLSLLFIFNNYLIFWKNWPGLWNFFAHHEMFGISPLRIPLDNEALSLGLVQNFVLVFMLSAIFIFVFKTPKRSLIEDAETLSKFAAYLTRACFWAVLLVGVIDITISFLRVEGFLNFMLGDSVAINLGRAAFRGTYVHYPLIIIGFVIALFVRGLGFTWLAFLVVIAEFQIVILRFVYSYEQAFMGDLVRMWYAALFLFSSSYALITEGHVRVDVFYSGFKTKTKALSNAIGCILLGLPLCWVILSTGMWVKGSSLNGPLLVFEIYQQGYGMYVKYLMVGFLVVFAVSMLVQFMGYFLRNSAELIEDNVHQDNKI